MHRLGFLPSSSSSLSLFAYHPIVPIFILIPILIAGHPSLASISCCATCSVLHYSHLGSVPAHVDMSCPPHRTVCIRILTSQLLVFISFSHLSLFLDVFCPLSCTIISVCLCLRLSSLCILLSLSLSLSHCFHWGLSRCHRRCLLTMLMPMPTYHGALVIHRIFKTQTSVVSRPSTVPSPLSPSPSLSIRPIGPRGRQQPRAPHTAHHHLEQTRGDLSCGPCAPDWH